MKEKHHCCITLCVFGCIIKGSSWSLLLFEWEITSSQKLRYFRGSRFSQCCITFNSSPSPEVSFCGNNYFRKLTIVSKVCYTMMIGQALTQIPSIEVYSLLVSSVHLASRCNSHIGSLLLHHNLPGAKKGKHWLFGFDGVRPWVGHYRIPQRHLLCLVGFGKHNHPAHYEKL